MLAARRGPVLRNASLSEHAFLCRCPERYLVEDHASVRSRRGCSTRAGEYVSFKSSPLFTYFSFQTCKILRSLAAERMTWARCLQNLGPHEPPSFSPHTLPSALGVLDLRRLSIRAFQKSRLWDSPRASSSFLRVTRETVIPIHDTNPDAVLGESQTFGLELFLLPGCDHLAILWPAGYLQIWSLEHKSCHFLYPDLPEGQSEDRPKLLCCFAYDVQVDGDIHLLLIEEYLQDPEMGDRCVLLQL